MVKALETKMGTYTLILIVAISGVLADVDPVVETTYGSVRGTVDSTSGGKTFYSFLGMPYANPPVGEYRFSEPCEPASWSGVLNATSYGPNCIQYNPLMASTDGEEDCRILNVLTSSLNETAKKPVIVFVHGGGWLFTGQSSYDLTPMMNYTDVVAVSFGYRLGPFGFASTGDDVIPGNAGLKDQVFALKWVQKNIKKFGGDPDNVTLLGHASGGACVHYHLMSNLSAGLFHKAILMSGTAIDRWCYASNPEGKITKLASYLGCSTNSSSEILACLNKANATEIAEAQMKLSPWEVNLISPFRPTVEKYTTNKSFLTQEPFTASANGYLQKIPLIISFTSQDGLFTGAGFLSADYLLQYLAKNWTTQASDIFQYFDTAKEENWSNIAEKIKEYYFDGENITTENFQSLVQAQTDRSYKLGAVTLAQLHAKNSGCEVYLYEYGFRGSCSLTQLFTSNNTDYGASHADDLMQIMTGLGLDCSSSDDIKMKKVFGEILYQFASAGTPTVEGVTWTSVSGKDSTAPCLKITSPTEIAMETINNTEVKSFWGNLGLSESENK